MVQMILKGGTASHTPQLQFSCQPCIQLYSNQTWTRRETWCWRVESSFYYVEKRNFPKKMAMATVARLHCHFMSLSKSGNYSNHILSHHRHLPPLIPTSILPSLSPLLPQFSPKIPFLCSPAGNGGSSGDGKSPDNSLSWSWVGPIGAFVSGWRSRVAADPQFPFKVVMEELVGISACVVGDMASRPNFGLNELDLVFSTLIVICLLNFILTYLLAPTISLPTGQISTRFSPIAPQATLVFMVGLVGTAISNGLIKMRKMVYPSFETLNKALTTILNAATWVIHMGVSSNLRNVVRDTGQIDRVAERGGGGGRRIGFCTEQVACWEPQYLNPKWRFSI
ncbi:alphavirus core family protein [Actinidia rufa]|uniref:Alphavirus core family protein n=1 Tax=Actinidia rufa TaxID=165716 RepID=A0A7J0FCU4_9ERIC|nr:alphavirus core family protein [Actinidia rufa]